MNIMFAARDTTAVLLTFTVYLLSIHPKVMTRLREEIMDIIPSGDPTSNAIRQLKYRT